VPCRVEHRPVKRSDVVMIGSEKKIFNEDVSAGGASYDGDLRYHGEKTVPLSMVTGESHRVAGASSLELAVRGTALYKRLHSGDRFCSRVVGGFKGRKG
jgi:hypothetical protein